MSRICPNCGGTLADNERFCSRCGQNVPLEQAGAASAQAQQPAQVQQPANNQYQQYQQYQQPGAQGYQQYQQPNQPYQPNQQYYNQPAAPTMTVGQWVGTILLTSMLGIISIILLFVWGFGNDVPEEKKNFCRGMLIVQAIALGLVILLYIIIIASGIGIASMMY